MISRKLIIGLDDTDIIGAPGTNQLARSIAETLPAGFEADIVLRHQLLKDPRIPFTSQNGAASIDVTATGEHRRTLEAPLPAVLMEFLRNAIREFAPEGSDPGVVVAPVELCSRELLAAPPDPAPPVPCPLVAFGRRCQREPVPQAEARRLARQLGLELEGLGGTEDGVIGALAAAGLRLTGDDGRVVHRRGWPWPDPFGGLHTVAEIRARGVDEVRVLATGAAVRRGVVQLGNRLRPAFRGGRVVLLVAPATAGPAEWVGLKLP